jgi:hypothetical protein
MSRLYFYFTVLLTCASFAYYTSQWWCHWRDVEFVSLRYSVASIPSHHTYGLPHAHPPPTCLSHIIFHAEIKWPHHHKCVTEPKIYVNTVYLALHLGNILGNNMHKFQGKNCIFEILTKIFVNTICGLTSIAFPPLHHGIIASCPTANLYPIQPPRPLIYFLASGRPRKRKRVICWW